MTEEQLKRLARDAAVDYVLSHLAALYYRREGYSPEAVQVIHDGMLNKLSLDTIGGPDAAFSDAAMGEITDAVESIFSQIQEVHRRLSGR